MSPLYDARQTYQSCLRCAHVIGTYYQAWKKHRSPSSEAEEQLALLASFLHLLEHWVEIVPEEERVHVEAWVAEVRTKFRAARVSVACMREAHAHA